MTEPLGRRFWAVWLSSSSSFLAEGLLLGAVPLLAATLTLDARLISITDAVQQAGWLLLGLTSGIAADRLPRLRIMWLANAARAVIAFTFAMVVMIGHASLPTLYLLGFLLGLAAPFFDNASSAVLPELVQPHQFQWANSLTQMALALAATLIGPLIGSAAFVLWPAAPFWFAAAAFAVGALVSAIASRVAGAAPASKDTADHRELLMQGLTYLWRHRELRSLAIAVGVVNFVMTGVIAVLVLYVLQILHLPQSAYGVVVAMFAVGGLAGALLTSRITALIGERTSVLVALGFFGASMIALGVFPMVGVAFPAIAVAGFFSMVWNVTVNSYRQRVVPLDLLGRVTSVFRMLAFLAMPVGALAAGMLSHSLGLPVTYLLGGVLLLISGTWTATQIGGMPNHPEREAHIG